MGNLDLNKKKQDEQIKVNIEAWWNTQAKLHIKESSKQVHLCFSILTGWRTFLKKQIPRPQWIILFHLRDKELSLGWSTFLSALNIHLISEEGHKKRMKKKRRRTKGEDRHRDRDCGIWMLTALRVAHMKMGADGTAWKGSGNVMERLWRRSSMEEMDNLRLHTACPTYHSPRVQTKCN